MKKEKKENSLLWVESHRWLLYFFASKNPITALWFVIPLLLFWIFRIDFNQFSLISGSALFVAGALLWTFLEYVIHRFIFHWRPKNRILKSAFESIHIYHHLNKEDQDVITSGPVFAIFWSALNFTVLYLILKNINQASFVMFGLTSAYYAYEWVHYLVHHKNFTSGPMKYLQDHHLFHHERWGKNYGQTSPLWDMLLGTYLPVKKLEEEKKLKYIFLARKS